MIKATFCVAALFLLPGLDIVRANLGDTEAQCLAKYGAESDLQDNLGFDVIGDKSASFRVKGVSGLLLIKIIFLDGVAAHEAISSADPARGLSEAQMQAILQSESASLPWHRTSSAYRTARLDVTYENEDWQRGDGAIARFWKSREAALNETGSMELSTRHYAAAQEDLDRQSGSR